MTWLLYLLRIKLGKLGKRIKLGKLGKRIKRSMSLSFSLPPLSATALCLRGIDLSRPEDIDAIEAIAAFMHDGLTSIDLNGCALGPDGFALLAPAIARLPGLLHIDIGDNNLGVDEVAPMLAALPHKSMQSLKIGHNNIVFDEVTRLMPYLRNMRNLKILDISEFNLGEVYIKPAKDLPGALKLLTQLTTLDLSLTLLDAVTMAALAPVLPASLMTLYLKDNILDCEGAIVLAPDLARLTSLRVLSLSGNGINTVGITALAPSLARLTALRRLDLSRNVINDDGMAVLAPALARLTQLKDLDLSSNEIGDIGAALCAPCAIAATELLLINVSCNQISPARIADLVRIFQDDTVEA
jgi:Ran GTPase-activating protein (RanGAP) involved in mRNA processing and transport